MSELPVSAGSSGPKFSTRDWVMIVLLASVNFTHLLDFVIIMPLGKDLMKELAISPFQFSTLISAYALSAFVVGLLGAVIADRFDRKHFLLFAYGGFAIATVFCGLAGSYETFLIARSAAGGFGGLAASILLAIIADVFPEGKRGTALGAVMSAFAFAVVVGIPLGLELSLWAGTGMPFLALGIASAAVWVVALAWMPAVAGHRTDERGGELKALLAVALTPTHLRSFAFMFFLVTGTFMVVPFIAPYMQFNGGMSLREVMLAYSLAGVFTLVGMNVIGVLTDRYKPRPVFLVVASGSMVMTLLITHLTPTTILQGTILATGFMVLATGRIVPAQAMMMASAKPAVRGRFSNLNNGVSHFATGLSALISGAMMTGGGLDETVPLEGYPRVGEVAVCFAVVAIALAFVLRPAEIPEAVEQTHPVPSIPEPTPA